MILIIGGVGQGKLEYACAGLHCSAEDITEEIAEAEEKKVFCHLEQWIRKEKDPQNKLDSLLQKNPKITILCDEVGCGVVPMDAEEREWRERTGRTCCELAKRAESVIRIYCGLPEAIKGKLL